MMDWRKKGSEEDGGRIEKKRKSKIEKEERSGGHVRLKKKKKKGQGKHFFKFSIAIY